MHTHSSSMWHRILIRSGFLQSQIKTPSSSLPSLFQLIKPSILHFSTSPTTSTNDQGGDFPVPSSNLNPSLLHNVQTITSSLDNFSTIPNEAKQRLEECKVMLSQDLVSECLARLRNDWAAAHTFFLWAGKQPGYAYSVHDYHSMVAILGKFKRFDTAWSLVEEMRANSLVMPRTIMIMIRSYCVSHDVAKAINAFHTMKRFGFSHGIEEFHDFLNALCRYKNVQDAEHLLLSNEASFPFETKSFNIVLNGWSNILINLRESKRFWRNMDSRGIRKDLISYSSMISCFSKAGNLKDVLKLFDQMKENGIEPDRKVYNSVIHALAKGRCMDKARELVEKMEESGFKPDTVTYNSLIRALCKTKKPDDAKGVLDEMSKRRISPSCMTFHALFHVARSSDEVFELLDQMQNVGCVPSMDTYIMLIRKFCGWKQFDSVFKLWHDVIPDNGLSPDRSAYIVLVHGLYLNGRLEEAAKFYEEMINKGFNPEPNTEKLIQAWVSGREAATRPIGPLVRYKGFVIVKDKN